MLWKARIEITLKKGVLDPQGSAVEKALKVLNYHNVGRVRIGKYMELTLEAETEEQAGGQVEEMCHCLLANPVIEDFSYTLAEAER